MQIINSLKLTKQILVSGMMSESETTSSFPDRLAELPKTPSASKLKQSKWSQLQHYPFNNNMKINLCRLSNLLLYQLLLYL